MPQFDAIAPFYDLLKRIVFQSAIKKAAIYYINEIPDHAQVLVLGGGTGELLSYFKAGQSITYIEQSQKMISLAKKRKFNCSVDFIQKDFLLYEPKKKFNAIVTPFFLDCFTEAELSVVFRKLQPILKKNGLWLQADFYAQNKFQAHITKGMYWFFRKTTST